MSNKDRRAKESEYTYELGKLVEKFLPTEKERLIYKTMEKTFGLHPMSNLDAVGSIKSKERKNLPNGVKKSPLNVVSPPITVQ